MLAGVALAGFALVLLGLLRLQVVQHDELSRLAEQNRIRLDVLRAPRGAIRDRFGRLLADNQPSFDIVFRPMPAESLSRSRAAIHSDWLLRVASLVQDDTVVVKRRVQEANRTGQTAVLRRNAPYSVMAAVEEMRADVPGVDVQVAPIRRYPEGTLGAQLLGYAGEINDQELEKRAEAGYRMGDLIGKTGVERKYEEMLRGQDGAEFVVVNAMGKRVSTLSEGPPRPPIPGHDVTLTIDLDIQRALEEGMAGVQHGAAVAMDPRDGAILAMVSKPVFDPNEFSRGITFARWRELTAGGGNPLLNRAIQSAYPPGSTFKVVTMLAGMQNGLVEAGTHLPTSCSGGYFYGGRRFGCWDKRGHGSVDLLTALQFSCDVYFYQLGLRLGLDRLQSIARAVGLGEKTGIDLPAETRGLVPTKEWYEKRFKGYMPKGALLNLGIGQGELLVSPLQLALMTSVVANGGRAVRPHVVMKVQGVPEFKIEKPNEPGLEASPEIWAAVHEAMRRVVDAGTGGGARLPGIGVAGKTGTAQNPHGNDHALFICYAPTDEPRIAIAVVAENSGHGGSVCAPIAARVLRRVLLGDSLATAPHPAAKRDTSRASARGAATDTTEAAGD
ncbi:MAG: penicillin-binding protein 2 [Candidatus Eisenbacteria bacterium]|uniref:Penicillin-binding protein 2 n=1 Tax=Eiseniibacteriota bacterium TaxID=2212470 RepID=A0A933SIE2_UNCEI|nr:penicillin-binding protein 2 [Candidatus Eisenbacteria bacterium]